MKAPVYDQTGKEVKEALLPKEIFDVEINKDLVYQVILAQTANRRQVSAHTKDRSEVRGGGKKPWRQKGTGRARHGSSRSPIWVGGGVTFGPTKNRNFKQKINGRMKKSALFMALSSKARGKLVLVLDSFKLKEAKTKLAAQFLNSLPLEGKTALVILPGMDSTMIMALRNIPRVGTMQAKDLNALDVLSFKYLLLPKESLKVMKETFLKEK